MLRILSVFLILISISVKAQEPQLKGGLTTFLKSKLIYPSYSLQHCIQGTIHIGFKLNANGDVYYTTVSKGIGIDLDDEALRLIRLSSGRWIVPLVHDSLKMFIVPVNFILEGTDCLNKNKAEIARAIQAYKNQEELTNVITNFYRNKEKGSVKPGDDEKILQIKSELEIDDTYLDNKVKDGLKKIKLGDKQGACEDFIFVKYLGSDKANKWLDKYCK